ncbi:MAG: hypothetical protein ACR2JC_18015 [Chloroflexota bacterium]
MKELLDAVTLRRLYVDERRTQAVIARQFDCTPQFVSLLVQEYGIRRPPSSPTT